MKNLNFNKITDHVKLLKSHFCAQNSSSILSDFFPVESYKSKKQILLNEEVDEETYSGTFAKIYKFTSDDIFSKNFTVAVANGDYHIGDFRHAAFDSTQNVAVYETHDTIQHPYIIRTVLLEQIEQNPCKLDDVCAAHLK